MGFESGKNMERKKAAERPPFFKSKQMAIIESCDQSTRMGLMSDRTIIDEIKTLWRAAFQHELVTLAAVTALLSIAYQRWSFGRDYCDALLRADAAVPGCGQSMAEEALYIAIILFVSGWAYAAWTLHGVKYKKWMLECAEDRRRNSNPSIIGRRYTVAFTAPQFIAQVRALGIDDVRRAVETAPWFASQIAPALQLEPGEPPTDFALSPLQGLHDSWGGFILHRGATVSFVLVAVADSDFARP